jgi:hypothetical protein
MSQKISFKQPNKYSQNSPECSILTLEFLEPPHPKIVPLALIYLEKVPKWKITSENQHTFNGIQEKIICLKLSTLKNPTLTLL